MAQLQGDFFSRCTKLRMTVFEFRSSVAGVECEKWEELIFIQTICIAMHFYIVILTLRYKSLTLFSIFH